MAGQPHFQPFLAKPTEVNLIRAGLSKSMQLPGNRHITLFYHSMNIFAHLNLLIFGSHTYTGSTETPTVVVILKPQMWGRPSQPPLGRHCCSLCLQVLPLSLFSPNIDFINEVFSSIRILSGQQ